MRKRLRKKCFEAIWYEWNKRAKLKRLKVAYEIISDATKIATDNLREYNRQLKIVNESFQKTKRMKCESD